MAGKGRHHPLWTLKAAMPLVVIGVGYLALDLPVVALALLLYGTGNGIYSIARGSVPLALFGADRYARSIGLLARPSLLAQATAPMIDACTLAYGGAGHTLVPLAIMAVSNVALVGALWRPRRRTGPSEVHDAHGLSVRLRQAGPIPLDVDLACGPGKMLALVNRSGSGKTTVLRTVAGLYRPTPGELRCGRAVWLDTDAGIDILPHRRRAGLVSQSYALFPHMTELGDVVAAMGRRPRAEREPAARVLLRMVHLGGLEHRRPSALSGGQQQRVAMVRALSRDPKVLLLDEPFSAVDRRSRRRMQDELASLRSKVRIPIVMVTHDLPEAEALADRICVLDAGETLRTGSPAEILHGRVDARVREALDLREAP